MPAIKKSVVQNILKVVPNSSLNPKRLWARKGLVELFGIFYEMRCATLAFFSLFCNIGEECAVAQNEPLFSTSFQLPVAGNPGAVGRSGAFDATAAMRQQWVGFDGAPQQFFIAADAELNFLRNFHGVGVSVMQDKVGPVTALNMGASYSFHIYLDKALLGIGAKFGVHNIKFSTADLHTSPSGLSDGYHQESDALLSGNEESESAFDVGLGAYYQSEKAYAGIAFAHLTAPEIELVSTARYKIRPVMTLSAGRLLGKDLALRSLEPRFELRTDFATAQVEMTLNVNIRKLVWFGAGVRIQDAIPIGIGVHLKNGLDIAYNYDVSISKLRRYNSGSHDIAVRYSFDLGRDKPTTRYKSVRIL